MNNSEQVNYPMIKLISVLVAWMGSMSWGTVASIMATIYTTLLITDWFWKRLWKPFFRRRGWIKDGTGIYMETTDNARL